MENEVIYSDIEDIVAVKIVRKPLLKFKDMETFAEILEGNELDKWLAELT